MSWSSLFHWAGNLGRKTGTRFGSTYTKERQTDNEISNPNEVWLPVIIEKGESTIEAPTQINLGWIRENCLKEEILKLSLKGYRSVKGRASLEIDVTWNQEAGDSALQGTYKEFDVPQSLIDRVWWRAGERGERGTGPHYRFRFLSWWWQKVAWSDMPLRRALSKEVPGPVLLCAETQPSLLF